MFIDMGVMDAATSIQFAQLVNYKYKKILMFEPDKKAFEHARKNIIKNSLEDALIFNEGCFDYTGKVSFVDKNGDGSSNISENISDSCIDVVKLDDKLNELREISCITYIKMDIEGAESQAIKGSVETIKKYKPKMAISIYHKDEDIYEIPLLIKKILPEYRLYVRHYNSYNFPTNLKSWKNELRFELVLYAIL